MLTNNRIKAALSVSLAFLFAAISIGAAMDGRWQAWPLALIFGVFTVYSFIKAVRLLRSKIVDIQ
jgi:hypothetical protein